MKKKPTKYAVVVYAPDRTSYTCDHYPIPSTSVCLSCVLKVYGDNFETFLVNGAEVSRYYSLRAGDNIELYTKEKEKEKESREAFLKRMEKKEILESIDFFKRQMASAHKEAERAEYNLSGALQKLAEML